MTRINQIGKNLSKARQTKFTGGVSDCNYQWICWVEETNGTCHDNISVCTETFNQQTARVEARKGYPNASNSDCSQVGGAA